MDKLKMNLKGKDALNECIRLWRLNNTFKGRIVEHDRILIPDDSFRTMSDEALDYFVSHSGCGAAICGNGQQRAYFQFMPKGTPWLYGMGDVPKARETEFRRTEHGRAIYDNAPEGAKRFYRRGPGYGEKPVYDLYRTLDDTSWYYIIAHAETEHLKADLDDIRAHMQEQPKGTNMFWWRGRHRPKNKDSFSKPTMRKIVEELALAKMGYGGGRMWFSEEKCREMTLADMRRSGLKALAMDLPTKGYGSNDFFFRGPFWDMHYWDESSRKRFIKAVHEMYNESPMAINQRYQAGVDYFKERNYRQLYLGAPEGAKKYYEVIFYKSSPNYHDAKEENNQCRKDMIAIYKSLTNEDWDYIIGHTHWGMAEWGLNKAREKYERKGNVQ